MHIKFISTGKGSASAAKNYLLQDHDHKGEMRADVQVIRGNPEHVTQLAESLDFKHKYTSGVIAWHKDDAPTDNQIAQVLDDFERVAFAGLDGNQYAYYAVQHEDADGAKHVHIIAPRVELSTGKSMNIAPPNHQKTYDVLVDKYNVQHSWASPKDISRQKTMTIDKMQIHAKTPSVEAKKKIHEVINELIERGSIANHADVRTKLAQFGKITREGKDYISIKPKGFKRAIRLKGAYYERDFSIGRVSQEVRAEQKRRIEPNQASTRAEQKRINGVLEKVIEKRAEHNQRSYGRVIPGPYEIEVKTMANTSDSGSNTLDRHRHRSDDISHVPSQSSHRINRDREEIGDSKKESIFQSHQGMEQRHRHEETAQGMEARRALDSSIRGGLNDRNRTTTQADDSKPRTNIQTRNEELSEGLRSGLLSHHRSVSQGRARSPISAVYSAVKEFQAKLAESQFIERLKQSVKKIGNKIEELGTAVKGRRFINEVKLNNKLAREINASKHHDNDIDFGMRM